MIAARAPAESWVVLSMPVPTTVSEPSTPAGVSLVRGVLERRLVVRSVLRRVVLSGSVLGRVVLSGSVLRRCVFARRVLRRDVLVVLRALARDRGVDQLEVTGQQRGNRVVIQSRPLEEGLGVQFVLGERLMVLAQRNEEIGQRCFWSRE